ncbi:MAG TPA: pentapeptide repeat-containing protein [Methylocella sp.]|nr:pentapeptide repeat-containing protein [Methylocella sp.]
MRTLPGSHTFRYLSLLAAIFGLSSPPRLSAAELTRAEIEEKIGDARGAVISLANLALTNADLAGLNLLGADFFSTKLSGATLAKADLSSANFTRTELQNTNFSGALMMGATLYAAELDGANFSNADLSHARVIGGGRGFNFNNAKLRNTDLGADPANQGMVPVRAELPDANFDGADLTGANFTHAVLVGATFT